MSAWYYIASVEPEPEKVLMDEELQKKMDTYNELLLKNAALTFSSEGISNDVKSFLSRKSVFVADMLTGLASLIEASSKGRVSANRQLLFDAMLEHALNEVKMVDSTFNYVLAKTFERESSLVPSNQQADGVNNEKGEIPKRRRKRKT